MSNPQEYEYMLLGRLQFDCEAYVDGPRQEKDLWALNVEDQITKMKELWEELKEKPEWLTMDQIEQYEQQMTAIKLSTLTKEV